MNGVVLKKKREKYIQKPKTNMIGNREKREY